MKQFLFSVVALTFVGFTPVFATEKPVGESDTTTLAKADKKPFSWEGSCEIKCIDGSCKFVCGAGVVYATSSFEAQLQAEASLRAQAGSQGTVKEGSIKLTIRGR